MRENNVVSEPCFRTKKSGACKSKLASSQGLADHYRPMKSPLARFIREGTANGGWYHDFEAKTPVAA
jgi:hypothetical protein